MLHVLAAVMASKFWKANVDRRHRGRRGRELRATRLAGAMFVSRTMGKDKALHADLRRNPGWWLKEEGVGFRADCPPVPVASAVVAPKEKPVASN